jgi:ubiquinone/menaquinone biosynthesis C-methylase UbiE
MSWYQEMFDYLGENYFSVFNKEKLKKAKKDVNFLIEVLDLKKGLRVLDLCCGVGRHTIPLAKKGLEMVGLDYSEEFITIAKDTAQKEGVTIDFRQGDMRELPFQKEFDVVINMWTSFGYLETDEENLKVLKEVAKSLRPQGLFLLDILNRDWVVRNFEVGEERREINGNLEINHYNFNSTTGRDTMRTIYIVDGQEREFNHSCRLYTLQEIQWLLKEAGFVVKKVYGGYDCRSFSYNTQRLIVIAELNGSN